MKYGLILFLLSTVMSWSQTSGTAESKGSCSPAVSGSHNQFTINCPGVSKEQIQKMLPILNKILAKQLDPDAVMKKLDDISAGVQEIQRRTGDRELTNAQIAKLTALLKKSPQTITVFMIGDREANA